MTVMVKHWRPQNAADLPDRLVLFDGVCVLCSRWVRFILARDQARRYRFISIQSPLGRMLAARFGIDADASETNAVIRGGKAWFKSDSALQVLRDLPSLHWTGVLLLLPRLLRNVVYDLVARNRYRLFGKSETCLLPTPELRNRFLSTADELA
jgi:predicted DCC family thiol-disulfide oxidoreductase YuxK